jgi:hypothetical protein
LWEPLEQASQAHLQFDLRQLRADAAVDAVADDAADGEHLRHQPAQPGVHRRIGGHEQAGRQLEGAEAGDARFDGSGEAEPGVDEHFVRFGVTGDQPNGLSGELHA